MSNIDREYNLWRIKTFTITWLAYAGFYFCRKNFAVVKPFLIDEFQFDKIMLGQIGTAYLGMYAIGQFLNGWLGDRLGSKITVGLGLLVAAVANFSFGFAGTLGMMMMLWGINGYAQASGWPGLVKTMANWFSLRERGIVMGWWGTCYQIGSAAATAFATLMMGWYGWRYSFFVPACILTGVALLFIFAGRNGPKDVGLPSIASYHGEATEEEEAAEDQIPQSEITKKILRNPTVWIFGSSYFCLKMVRYALMFWLPLYMVERLGYAPTKAGYYSITMEIVGFLGAICAGYASDKIFGSRRGPVVCLMFVGLALALFFHTKLALMGEFWNVVGMALIGFMTYGPDSLMTGAAAMDFGSRQGAATAAGIINGMGSVGAAFQGILVGYVSTYFGWNSLFFVFTGLAALGAVLTYTRWNTVAHSIADNDQAQAS